MEHRSWFAVDGTLEPIAYDGPSAFRFPESVAEHVVERYSKPGEWVLDPFCGFGTALVAAERLGRHAVGCEIHDRRHAFAAARLADPDRVVHGPCEELAAGRWPPFSLLLTSPPYRSFRSFAEDDDPATYRADVQRLFSTFSRLLAPTATIAVVASQVRLGEWTRPTVWQLGGALNEIFPLREELVRVNTSDANAGPGYDHDQVLVFGMPG